MNEPALSRPTTNAAMCSDGLHAAALIEAQGGVIVGLATIQMDDSDLTRQLRARYRCHSLSPGM